MKIGIQSGCSMAELGPEQACRLYREAGFEVIDWNLDAGISKSVLQKGQYCGLSPLEKPLEEILSFYADELRAMEKYGLRISQAHAPFPAYVEGRPESLDYMLGLYRNTIRLCAQLGIPRLVIHGISWGKKNRTDTAEQIAELNRKLYTSLIPELRKCDVTVCMENLFSSWESGRGEYLVFEGHGSDPYATAELIDSLNREAGKECFGLCFDTGHLHLLKKDMRVWLPILGSRVKALHIHDNDGENDLHMAPYTGSIVWGDFCDTLRKIGYSGDLCFETFRQTSVGCIDREMVAPWLSLIHACGVYFRNRIETGGRA